MNPKIFLHVTGGLGDVLAECFMPATENHPCIPESLPRMLHAWRESEADQVAVVYRSGSPNPAVPQLFAAMGLRTYMAQFKAGDNSIVVPNMDLSDWVDASTLKEPEDISLAKCPTVQPLTAVPSEYVLFNEGASHPERRLVDAEIYRAIKSAAPGVPIVKVGTQRSLIPCDIDLTDRTTASETAWLAKHAKLIVSAATFHRCWSALFGVRVVELIDERRAAGEPLARTAREYELGRYGMTPKLNQWMLWPSRREDLSEAIRTTLATSTPT